MYDLIGDIHGHARELEVLLDKLGYSFMGGCHRHDSRTAIFLGDFIDRGPEQEGTLKLVRPMIDDGAAMAVMGNHEYNAIAFFTRNSRGSHLRERNDKNIRQHQAFFDKPGEWRETVEWFGTLPLWLDLRGLRVVHACWDPDFIARITQAYGTAAQLTEEMLHRSADRDTWEYRAIETLLKGKEIELPDGGYFHDKNGNRRHEIRVKWWATGQTYREVYMGPEGAVTHIPDDPIKGDHMVEYGHEEKPVFLGHYWLDGMPSPLADNIACVDYSVAKPGGKLVAYRWDGERKIEASKYVISERID